LPNNTRALLENVSKRPPLAVRTNRAIGRIMKS